MPCHARQHFTMRCVKMAELINWVVYSRMPEGSTSSIVFTWWCQCALMEGHIGATRQIRLNRPSAAAMRPYVKLL